ncbi:MAG: hypothetical protein INR64_19310 [Caulobacteraceae bacterium]|nr:hypothetical protein [Caulobacter sp.]
MHRGDDRVADAAALGQGDRRLDLALGSLAFAPLVLAALGVWIAPRSALTLFVTVGVDAWAGGLLCFWAGVRRGLTFSERRGAAAAEIATFLAVFFVGVAGIALSLPWLLALGFVAAGAADLAAARRAQAPTYFRRLRPAQAVVGALSLLAVAARLAA